MDSAKKRTRIPSIILGVTLLIEVISVIMVTMIFGDPFINYIPLMVFATSVVYAFVFYLHKKWNHGIRLHFWMTMISVVVVDGGMFFPFMDEDVFLLFIFSILLYAVIYAILHGVSNNNSAFLAGTRVIVSSLLMYVLKIGPYIFLSFSTSLALGV